MKIIILTGRFGMGHISVSNAVKQDIEENIPEADCRVYDIFEYLLPNLHKQVYQGFIWVTKNNTNLYNSIYGTCEGKTSSFLNRLFMSKIHQLIELEKPDIIVSTLALSSQFISSYKAKYRIDIPLITYITDISSSNEWISFGTNHYVAATQNVKDELIKKGVLCESVLVAGIPVKKRFIKSKALSKSEKERKNILIMGGGLGLLPEDMEFYSVLNDSKNATFTIITGNNRLLFNKLNNQFDNIDVLGFCDNVAKYLNNADLLISKAGGITLFESIQSETPMVVPSPTMAQEINNAHYIEDMHIGLINWNDEEDMAQMIKNLINDRAKYNKMIKNMHTIKKSLINQPMKTIISSLNMSQAIC